MSLMVIRIAGGQELEDAFPIAHGLAHFRLIHKHAVHGHFKALMVEPIMLRKPIAGKGELSRLKAPENPVVPGIGSVGLEFSSAIAITHMNTIANEADNGKINYMAHHHDIRQNLRMGAK